MAKTFGVGTAPGRESPVGEELVPATEGVLVRRVMAVDDATVVATGDDAGAPT
jgi:hypothetical protein